MVKNVDYIIVGCGIAGTCFAQQALLRGKSILVFDGQYQSATRTAAGTLNPVVWKRMNAVWNVQEFFDYSYHFYRQLEQQLNVPFLDEMPIYRSFQSIEEQNDWLVASDRKELSHFLDPQVHYFPHEPWDSTLGFGKVKNSLRLDTVKLLDAFREYLIERESFRMEQFQYNLLKTEGRGVSYQGVQATRVIFAEGVQAKTNPIFPAHLLIPKKGEYITVRVPNLKLDAILKDRFFYIPLGGDLIKVGATFAHGDETDTITDKGREELMQAAINRFSNDVAFVNQVTGKRPTVKDRRPLLGSISEGSPYFFLNGLGTRGLLAAPQLSKWLLEFMEDAIPLDPAVDIRRFLS